MPNYTFRTQAGDTTLLELLGDLDRLLAIHNMGQGCRYCTLWADGFNGFLPHLESVMSVVLVSKDDPDTQRRFANARGWRFRLASHGGGNYIKDQTCSEGPDNAPGAVVYERGGDLAEFRVRRCHRQTSEASGSYCPLRRHTPTAIHRGTTRGRTG